jgi:hypothetical protein
MDQKHQRVPIPESVQAQVVVASRRRCCLCYYLYERRGVQKGQIAHLNQDRSNPDAENLVFLCLEHHDEFDSRTSQSKGYLPQEVRLHRDRLYRELDPGRSNAVRVAQTPVLPEPMEQLLPALRIAIRKAIQKAPLEFGHLLTPWKLKAYDDVPSFLFAFKAANRCDGICRIDRLFLPDGRVAVICTELPRNPGSSITDSVELIAFQVCAQFKIKPGKLVWIEHYATPHISDREWYLVSFRSRPPRSMFNRPAWKLMNREDWHALGLQPPGGNRMPHRSG